MYLQPVVNLQSGKICGAESENQEKVLRAIGCEMGSGYYFYYPLSVEAFELAAND